MADLTLEEFLGHTTNSRGNRLRGWRDRTPPRIDTVLHRRKLFTAVWQHNVPRIVERRDKDSGETSVEVWSGSWNCHEDEQVLKSQFKRDKKTGERLTPPQICPTCLLIEIVRGMIADGSLGFCDTVFRFEGDDSSKAREITAAGLTNQYRRNDLTKDEKSAMRTAGVRASEGWKEVLHAKCNYIFAVVDNDSPGDGVQVAVETTSLGDDVKRVIRERMQDLGHEEGNPLLHPYVIRWEYKEKADPRDKYRAAPLTRIEISEEVLGLISDDPPDTSAISAPGDIAELRTTLEAHALIDLPWDEIFGPAERVAGSSEGDTQSSATDPVAEKPACAAAAQQPAALPELYECDRCGKETLTQTDTVCSECGARYDSATGALLEEEPAEAGAKAVAEIDAQADAWDADADDDIPF